MNVAQDSELNACSNSLSGYIHRGIARVLVRLIAITDKVECGLSLSYL